MQILNFVLFYQFYSLFKKACEIYDWWFDGVWDHNYITQDNRELKHRRFRATDVNRKSRLLLFDAYSTLFIQKVKL